MYRYASGACAWHLGSSSINFEVVLCFKRSDPGHALLSLFLQSHLRRKLKFALNIILQLKMLFKNIISPEKRALAKLLLQQGWSLRQIADEVGMSKSSVGRLKQDQDKKIHPPTKTKKSRGKGRPQKLSEREKRRILRCIEELRESEGYFTAERLMQVAGVSKKRISIWTFRRFLNSEGFFFFNARQKGIMSRQDRLNRVRYCREIRRNHPRNVWTEDIAFYLDGVNFVHKTRPNEHTYAPKKRVWRKKTEGLKHGCLAKGRKEGTGVNVVRFMVAIAHRKGVIMCEEYDKLNGAYFADFVQRNFVNMFGAADKDNARYFVQDGDPSQNSRVAKEALRKVKAEIFPIPARSPDLNPIENVFHLANKRLHHTSKYIDFENRDEFVHRIKAALHSIPVETIDKTIESMDKRIGMILTGKGERIKY